MVLTLGHGAESARGCVLKPLIDGRIPLRCPEKEIGMSRTVAKIIKGIADAATLPMSPRLRGKTLARVAEGMGRTSVRAVDTPHGPLKFYALRSANMASAIERFNDDEPETFAWIDGRMQPGDTLWDIGANVGLYSLYAAKKGVKVMAFEPSAINLGLLAEHIQLNGLDKNVSPVCVALGRETKMETLHLADMSYGGAGNGLGSAENQFSSYKPVFAQGIPAFRGDDFCRLFNIPVPDHIKLDVDGIEAQILEGLSGVLPQVKTITVEVEGRNADDARAIMGPILAAGLTEDESHRAKGSARNRLYINPKK